MSSPIVARMLEELRLNTHSGPDVAAGVRLIAESDEFRAFILVNVIKMCVSAGFGREQDIIFTLRERLAHDDSEKTFERYLFSPYLACAAIAFRLGKGEK